MSVTANNNLEYFNVQYKVILQKSNDALVLESKGNKYETYSLFKHIINSIDNTLAIDIHYNDTNLTQEGLLIKQNNLKSLRNNICECVERIRQENCHNNVMLGELLYSIEGECQYTKISCDGTSNVPCYPSSLQIYKYSSTLDGEKGFIIVSDWIGALIQNVTPILITPEGVLMFFDTENESDVRIAVTLPYNISEDEFKRFISVLSTLAVIVFDGKIFDDNSQQILTEKSMKSTGEVIAGGLTKVSQSMSNGVVFGASKLGELVTRGSKELCNHINPGHAPMNPNVKTGIEYARIGSNTMIQIGGKAFGVLTRATQYIASKAAPHIIATANKVIPNDWKEEGKNGEISKVDQMALVTGSSLQGLSLLFDSLHEGSIVFGRCVARSSGQIMRHRYGEEVGQSTENVLYAAGNLGMVAMIALQFTKKGIMKTAAKVTAIEVTEKYRKQNSYGTENNLEKPDFLANNGKHIL